MLSPSSTCNLKCKMCPNANTVKGKKTMTFSGFKRIIDNVKPRRITIVGPGETFINPDIIDILNYAKKKCSWVSTTSNFTMAERFTQDIIKSQIDVIKISIDGATKTTYEKIRRGANFESVIKNIQKLVEEKRKKNSYLPSIRFNYVIQKDNYHEIDEIIKIGSELGVDNIAFAMVRTSNKELLDIPHDKLLQKINQGHEIARRRGMQTNLEEIKNNLQRYKWDSYDDYCKLVNNNGVKKFHGCVYPWLSALIDVQGNVTPCCSFSLSSSNDFFGNALNSDWGSIWNGEKFLQLRKHIKRREKVPVSCQSCNGIDLRSLISINKLLPNFT